LNQSGRPSTPVHYAHFTASQSIIQKFLSTRLAGFHPLALHFPRRPVRGPAACSFLPYEVHVPASSPKIAVFPGTFDPLTLGHLDIIDRGRKLFDQLIVAIGVNPVKEHLFSVEERLTVTRQLTKKFKNVRVEAYEGLTMRLVKKRKAAAILRGLRNLTDLDYEFRIALTNRKLAGVETVFIMTAEEFGFTSSSLIKQIVILGGNPHQLKSVLPRQVIDRLIYYRENKLGPFGTKPIEHV
jgi:pantetheine-phosphate adenylyltransferase